jgi:hypothetical protein
MKGVYHLKRKVLSAKNRESAVPSSLGVLCANSVGARSGRMHSNVVMCGFARPDSSFSRVAAEPIKIGFSCEETGGSAASGKQFVLTRGDLGRPDQREGRPARRPVKLIHYDDQSNPALVPGIYTSCSTSTRSTW